MLTRRIKVTSSCFASKSSRVYRPDSRSPKGTHTKYWCISVASELLLSYVRRIVLSFIFTESTTQAVPLPATPKYATSQVVLDFREPTTTSAGKNPVKTDRVLNTAPAISFARTRSKLEAPI